MDIKAVLFDLDGTLLPMDQDEFIKAYFGGISKKLVQRGYEPSALIKAIWGGTEKMIKNDGKNTNEQIFWDFFTSVYGEQARKDIPYFDEFYRTDFQSVKQICGFSKKAKQVIEILKQKKIPAILATNPIFPAVATEARISWAGLDKNDFVLYTTYENINYCKPNLAYYSEIALRIGVLPQECLMVGNDVDDDMVAQNIGMQTFLLTDNLINKSNADIEQYVHGNFNELCAYFNTIL